MKCAVSVCDKDRLEGSSYCAKHGPTRKIAKAKPPTSRDGNMVCPHCQVRGHVHTRRVKMKKGVSGGKATAAVLTGGLSLLAAGLSRKEVVTEASCSNCGAVWHF